MEIGDQHSGFLSSGLKFKKGSIWKEVKIRQIKCVEEYIDLSSVSRLSLLHLKVPKFDCFLSLIFKF